MKDSLRTILKIAFLVFGLIGLYIIINGVVASVNANVQESRDNNAGANIIMSSISREPFGDRIAEVKRGEQVFYNLTIKRVEGSPCFVQTSWRWVLHMPTGNSVMWNNDDGQFFAGDKNENLAQAIQVPANLIPGSYTLSRLSVFKCGNNQEFARTVRDAPLMVK